MIKKILPTGRFGIALSLSAVCLLIGIAWLSMEQKTSAGTEGETGTLEKMIVASGNAAMDIDLNKLNGAKSRQQNTTVNFALETNAFFKSLVFNDEFRGSLPSSMKIIPQNSAALPSNLNSSMDNLVLESLEWGGQYELAVRDGVTGFTYFNIEGQTFDFDSNSRSLGINGGRLLISEEFATSLNRPSDTGTVVGAISVSATLTPIEITKVINGEVESSVLPAGHGSDANVGTVPGPDVVVGDLTGLAQFGASSGTQVGLAVGTDSCNFGTVDLDWFANPSNNHPVIPQNLYRMSGGANNDERFEQIGQSSVKHAFTALTNNICSLGCNGIGGTRLGSGCSDPYSASLNAGSNNALGSRAWINPFTGAYPRNDSATPNNSHSGHTHTGPSHRILTEIADLAQSQNPGATYYAESQYVTPHEYVWCQANPTQCNMFNNVSYRKYNVIGSASPFSFSPSASTVRLKTAISAWPGASLVEFRPDTTDGMGIVAYKVTNPSPGVWHYEYAIFNQNLDRGIQSFSVPAGSGVTMSNVAFKSPPQHPGSSLDGSLGGTGFSSAAWSQLQSGGTMTWSTETFAQNQNANAIRWGTMYNFRFDSNRPPQISTATIGFYKTGAPITVQVQAPTPAAAANVSISGRVTNAFGQGQGNVLISLTDSAGFTRTGTRTGSLGYYQFDNLVGGGTYTISVISKRYVFEPRTVVANDNVFDFDFTPVP